METVIFAVKNKGAIGLGVNFWVRCDNFEAFTSDGRFWVVFFKMNAETSVEIVEILVAEFAAVPVILGEFAAMEILL